ncbi:nucleotidyltransferase domain-containing protein [Rhodocaloribacter litoris]|uniref:nucleotidyltransferase family protein n=1 Tax=Rhodocaloribacter litoris TaxID=2558931 RepID=UPI0014204C8A|nr:nucleotidyltransferase domain-containing protein [Rhodocaloribacter litoris]QXD14210.1 nucleotidyltransferase domain-containing protein [Rhodocaloribacter litoris]
MSPFPQDALARFCRRHHIIRLSLFGSVLHGTAGPDSDLDLLVEFDPDHVPGFIGLSAIEQALSEAVGRRVDLRTPKDLSPWFREAVRAEASVLYDATG